MTEAEDETFTRKSVCKSSPTIVPKLIKNVKKEKEPPADDVCNSNDSTERSWYDGCEFECVMCKKLHFDLGPLLTHIKVAHSITAVEYKRRSGGFETRSVRFRCLICGEAVKHTEECIRHHLENTHLMTIKAYEERIMSIKDDNKKDDDPEQEEERGMKRKYEADEFGSETPLKTVKVCLTKLDISKVEKVDGDTKVENDEKDDDEDGDESDDFCSTIGKPLEEDDAEEKEEEALASDNEKCDKDSTMSEESEASDNEQGAEVKDEKVEEEEEEEDDDTKMEADADKEEETEDHCSAMFATLEDFLKSQCKYECKLCNFVCKDSADFWDHAYVAHQIEKGAYRERHGSPLTEKNKLECPSCFKLFLHEPTSLANHAKEHGVSPKGYYVTLFRPNRKEDAAVTKEEAEFKARLDKWAQKCEFKCRLCDTEMHSLKMLTIHILSKHGMAKEDYIKIYGQLRSKTVRHRCLICKKVLVHAGFQLKLHMSKFHDMSLTQYYKDNCLDGNPDAGKVDEGKSDSETKPLQRKGPGRKRTDASIWVDQCEYECKICRVSFASYFSVSHHLKNIHNLSAKDYAGTFGSLCKSKKFHTCLICSKTFTHCSNSVKSHLATHDTELDSYYRNYVLKNPASSTQQDQIVTVDNANSSISSHQDVGIADLSEKRMNDADLLQSYMVAAGKEAEAGGDESGPVVVDPSSDWQNGCQYQCAICNGNLTSLASFREHLEQLHQVDDFDLYVGKYGDPAAVSVLFKCPVCAEVMNHDGDDISPHLAEAHPDMSEDEYKKKYFEAKRVQNLRPQGGNNSRPVSTTSTSSRDSPVPGKRSKKSSPGCMLEWNHSVFFCPSCPLICYNYYMIYHHMKAKKMSTAHAIRGPRHNHTCHVCRASIKCTFGDMKDHLKSAHSMTLPDYEQKYYELLKDELGKAELASRAFKHPGHDPNFRPTPSPVVTRERRVALSLSPSPLASSSFSVQEYNQQPQPVAEDPTSSIQIYSVEAACENSLAMDVANLANSESDWNSGLDDVKIFTEYNAKE